MQNTTISYLKFFHGIIKFGKFAAILFIIITFITSISNPNQIDIPVRYEIPEVGTVQFENTQENKAWIFEGEGRLRIKSAADAGFTSMAAFNILFSICIALASYMIYFLLDKIVKSTIAKKPFSNENADSMKWLGFIFIVMGILASLYQLAGVFFLDGSLNSEIIKQDTFSLQIFTYILQLIFNRSTLLGLFALLFSQILRYGVELKEENALTI